MYISFTVICKAVSRFRMTVDDGAFLQKKKKKSLWVRRLSIKDNINKTITYYATKINNLNCIQYFLWKRSIKIVVDKSVLKEIN